MRADVRVVIIDDDSDLLRLVEATLRFTAGWFVEAAGTGDEGLDIVRRLIPDVVLVDFMMPGMDGLEVCRRLRDDELTAGIPLVLLTARAQLAGAQARAVGARGVIVKPFEIDLLASQVLALMESDP